MTINEDDVNTIAGGGGEVRTVAGDKVGKIGQVYFDDDSGRPSWVTVKTGLFGTQESFVPLSAADLDGVDVVVPYDKDTIKGAPRVDSDGSVTPQEENRLYSYYFSAPTLSGVGEHTEVSKNTGNQPDAHLSGRPDHDDDDDRSRDRYTDDDRNRDQYTDDDRSRDRHTDDDRSRDQYTDDDRSRDRVTEEERRHRERESEEGRNREPETGGDETGGEVGTPRLRRYVVTEKVVPVSREEVPLEDSDRG